VSKAKEQQKKEEQSKKEEQKNKENANQFSTVPQIIPSYHK
jgi:hypothetical protein